MTAGIPVQRSRYYDAILRTLDNDIRPHLESTQALFAYGLVRRLLARLATLNDHAPFLPENLASLEIGRSSVGKPPSAGAAAAVDGATHRLLEEGERLDEIERATDARLVVRERGVETVHVLPESINAKSVETYLRDQLDPQIRIGEIKLLSGGRSKQTILVRMTDGSGRASERIIRRDTSSSVTGGTVPEEFEVLSVLSKHGLPVPRPILCEPDASKLGSPFIVVEKVPGARDGYLFDPPGKAAVLDSARVLGRLHALPLANIAPALRERYRVPPTAAGLRALIETLRKTWQENARAASEAVDFAFRWLRENVEGLQPLQAVVHGDYSYHNILFEGAKVSAVLDWELVRAGHPAEDLGYVRPAALKRVKWSEFMAAYREGGGPAIARKDQLFYTLLEKFRLLAMLFKVRTYVESGASDDIEFVDALVVVAPQIIHQTSVELRDYIANPE